ncbi:hypothetical protein LTR84_005442 [Exophiala bonariae]|uniref:FAD-binding PCMH-type domain-containing protein n=1 Tax=Exophiala bonariae TaxID=1690606 RepID=A0AAV9N3Q6_9EURO|nr:hypothetical protein LTR84_005442 [Exophiala bonariae]
MAFPCPTFRKGDPEYEQTRCNAVWNGHKPERYPDIIIQVNTEEDVVAAVKYAWGEGMKIGVRSGGHSWTASFLRDAGMLIDVSKLNGIAVDPKAGTAVVGPGTHGGDLNGKLQPHGYMFPGGHCPTVGLGGYLLQGGFGWNSRLYGLGCESVIAVDVVLPDGTLVHADADNYSDLYWAARGAGHGFFGVVTHFHLRCHPLPKAIMNSRFWFSVDHLDELISTLDDAHELFPRFLELFLLIGHDQEGTPGLSAHVRADVLATSDSDARQALSNLHGLPIFAKARKTDLFRVLDLSILLDDVGELLEVGNAEFVVDNTWMNEPVRNVLPQIHDIVDKLGPAPAHLSFQYWNRNGRPIPDMAHSLEGKVYISHLAIYVDPKDYEKWARIVPAGIGRLAKKGVGSQLADENLLRRPTRFMSPANFLRLEKIRRKYDPTRRFHGFMALTKEDKLVEVQVQSEMDA